ncbi:MAG TPA: FAD-binding oxidoreductase, partial [Candidatus Hydrogenedentes bacterium]|nr:FAD-binding oxidoreductase [Candidatus Hydrogenedentota bacterium]
YGTTIDHVAEVEVVLPDGRVENIGPAAQALPHEHALVDKLIRAQAPLIRERFHTEIVKRWPGYAIDRYLHSDGDLSKVFAGSEGTLGAITSAVLKLVPLPARKGLGIAFFSRVDEAMQATVEFLDLKPAAIEHVDRFLLDQTKGKLAFQPARELLRLDEEPCASFLIVEFYEDVDERLAAFAERRVGLRSYVCKSQREMDLVWALRKSGLSLMTGRKGSAKPIAGIEDVCVRPAQLPEYTARLEEMIQPLGLEASFYGHAASGLVHVRPIVDLHKAEDIAKFRKVAEGVAALTREFGGSFAGEHGVGIARTEFMADQIGPELLEVMRKIKAVFDPKQCMNPDKVIPRHLSEEVSSKGRFRIDGDLRQGAGHAIALPFEPVLAYAKKDEAFVAHLEQCNGCGECRKDAPTMCPTYTATGDEIMSTRGRANTIRAALEQRLEQGAGVLSLESLDQALGNCLACKACQKECPSNVDMALLKAELVHQRHQVEGTNLRERLLSRVDRLGALGCIAPSITNAFLDAGWFRRLLEKTLGIAAERPLPKYTAQPFHRWFAKRRPAGPGPRGKVYLWDDCFVRYNEPHIGQAATRVLEAAGFEVVLPEGHVCCGRPAFSMGCLDIAKGFGTHNMECLANEGGKEPIVFLEASCYS